jgi:hypothetical protein
VTFQSRGRIQDKSSLGRIKITLPVRIAFATAQKNRGGGSAYRHGCAGTHASGKWDVGHDI